jgi:hypothetical protein
MSNTDVMFEMAQICYETDDSGHWTGPKVLGDNSLQVPSCPTCKVSLTGIQRYNRRVNWVNLNKSGLKYNKQNERQCNKLFELIAKYSKDCTDLFEVFSQGSLHEALTTRVSNLAKRIKKARLPEGHHPFLAATSVIQQRDILPPTVNTDASAFEKAKAGLAYEYLRLLITCLQYRVSFDPSSKCQTEGKVGIVPPESLQFMVERVEALYEKSIALSISSRGKLGQIKVMLLDLSYRMQLRDNLPKLYISAGDLPELDVIRRVHSLAGQQLEERPGKILHLIEDLETLAPSAELLKMKEQVQAYSKCLASTEVTAEELKIIYDVMKADVGAAMGSFGGHWYCCPNGHPYSIGECGGAMEQSTCPQCGETIGGSSHRLATGNKVYEPLASKQFGHLRPA